MKTITLYRPIGLKELELIRENDSRGFPPRLPWQPIFYPVLNFDYAAEIAERWNVPDEFSGYCGFVTAFEVNSEYLKRYEVQNVGLMHHNELWIPANELETFNHNIIGKIKVVKAFYGQKYKGNIIDLDG